MLSMLIVHAILAYKDCLATCSTITKKKKERKEERNEKQSKKNNN